MINLLNKIDSKKCYNHKGQQPQKLQALCIDPKCFQNRNLCVNCIQDHQNHQMIDYYYLVNILGQDDANLSKQLSIVQKQFNILKNTIIQSLEELELKIKLCVTSIRSQFSTSDIYDQLVLGKENITQNQLQEIGNKLSDLLVEKKQGEIEYYEIKQFQIEETQEYLHILNFLSKLAFSASYLAENDSICDELQIKPLSCYQYFSCLKASKNIQEHIKSSKFDCQDQLVKIEQHKSEKLSSHLLQSIETLKIFQHQPSTFLNDLSKTLQEYLIINSKIQYHIEPWQFERHTDQIGSITISEDGRFIASSDNKGIIVLWELKNLKQQSRQLIGNSQIQHLQFSCENKYLAAAQSDKPYEILLFDLGNLQSNYAQIQLKRHQDTIWRIKFTKDSKFMISGSSDKNLIIWNIEKQQYHSQTLLSSHVCGVSISQNEYLISGCCRDGMVYLFECAKGYKIKQLVQWQAHKSEAYCTIFTPDNQQLITSYKDIRIWSIAELIGNEIEKVPQRIIENNDGLWDLHIMIKGEILISSDKYIKLWNLKSGQLIQQINMPSGQQFEEDRQIGVSSDMKQIVIGGKDNKMKCYMLLFI